MRTVALRGPVTVAITFGPTTAPTLARVLELATSGATLRGLTFPKSMRCSTPPLLRSPAFR